MKNIAKFISTIILAVAIFSSSAFACGDQNNGNKSCLVENQPTISKSKTSKTREVQRRDFLVDIKLFLFKMFI